LPRERLNQDGLSVDYGIQRNRFAGLFKRKIVNKLKSCRRNYVLNRVYKKYFINNQDKKNAIVLASFGKSGNTWVRFIFANIIALQEIDGGVITYHKLEEMLPDEVRQEDMYKPWRFKTIPCIVKTHKPYKEIYDHFNKFFLYRNPLDTMISHYYYITTRTADPVLGNSYKKRRRVEDIRFIAEEWKKRGPGGYMRHALGLDRWCNHYTSWMNNCDVSCSYEELKSAPMITFKTVLDNLSLQVDDEVLEEAIKRSNFRKIQALEDEFGKSPQMAQLSTRFARKGTIGQWQNYFDKSDISYFKAKMLEYNIDISCFEYGNSLDL
jgi:hypothetical protein